MRRLLLIQLALLLIASAIVAGSSSFASAGKKCVTIGEKRVCFEEGKNKKNDDDDDDDDDHKLKKKAGNKCEGEISCPAGYVVLDKPNKYGACCEPKEGLPQTETQQKASACPAGTELFQGKCMFRRCSSYSPEAAGEPKDRVSVYPRAHENLCTGGGTNPGNTSICKSRPNPTKPEWLLWDCCCYSAPRQ